MKPKQLKFPFTWENRRPHLEDNILYIPQYYDKHEQWDFPLFTNDKPLCIEFCSGNGDWILEMAKRNPDKQWVAVEKKFERVRKIWSKRANLGIENLLIVCGKAEPFVDHYLKKERVEKVYVNFPDPWPKDRHAKHRIIQPAFASALSQILRPEGEAIFVTDDRPYCEQMIEVMLNSSHFTSVFPTPFFSHHWEDYGTSWFENLWKTLGRKTHYLHFRRK